MPVYRKRAALPRRYPSWRAPFPVFSRRINTFCLVPLRLGTSLTMASLIVSGMRFIGTSRSIQEGTGLAITVLIMSLFMLLISLLGIFTGRTILSSAINSFHIVNALGAVGYLLWFVSKTTADVQLAYIFFYSFSIVPPAVELLAVHRSIRKGVE